MSKIKSILILTFILVLSACATVRAPEGTVPKRMKLSTEAYGGWIGLRLIFPQDSVVGEFIALDNDSLYIMHLGNVRPYAKSNIAWARVILFKTESDVYGLWTALATILTISNGAYGVITLPITLIAGIATTSGEAKRKNYIDYPVKSIEELAKYARFPQGMPEGINTADLKPKPAQ